MSSIRRRPRDPRAMAIGVAVLMLGLIACGSTVQDRSQLARRQGNTPVDEFGNPIPGATSTGGASFVPGQPGSTIGGGGGGHVPGVGGPISPNRNGPGVTSKTIAIGNAYCDDQEGAAKAIGFSPAPSDEKRAWDIVLADANSHGGVGGRKIEMIWYRFDDCQAAQNSISESYESVCQNFTRDHKVFAVMGAQENVPNYIACILKAGSVIIDNNVSDYDKQFQRQYPYFIQPGSLAADTFARLEVSALKDKGYFKKVSNAFPLVKVGIVMEDTPGFERVLNGTLLPALRDAGYPVSSENIAKIQHLERFSDLGGLSASISAAVLNFSSHNVSHVLFLQSRATLTLFFLKEADSQRYYPRYGLNSQDGPQAIKDYSGGSVISARNFRDAMGIGWDPGIDVSLNKQPPSPPEKTACISLLKSHGFNNFGDANATAIALGVCDAMNFLKLSIGGAGSVVNQATFLAAVNRIGAGRYRTCSSLGDSLLTPTKHDGNNQYRILEFDEGNGYFTYTSDNITIGY